VKTFRVTVEADLEIEFEEDKATGKSAEFVAAERFLYSGRVVPVRSNALGAVTARQIGNARARGAAEVPAGTPKEEGEDLWKTGGGRWRT
jgi:hypothetical protein